MCVGYEWLKPRLQNAFAPWIYTRKLTCELPNDSVRYHMRYHCSKVAVSWMRWYVCWIQMAANPGFKTRLHLEYTLENTPANSLTIPCSITWDIAFQWWEWTLMGGSKIETSMMRFWAIILGTHLDYIYAMSHAKSQVKRWRIEWDTTIWSYNQKRNGKCHVGTLTWKIQ